MEKKYTMEEFEEMFVKAQAKTMTILEKTIREKDNGKEMDAMTGFVFTMQNMMVMSELYKNLFKGEGKNE